MDHPRTLIQLDTDQHPSVFDAMVAIDAGVDKLLQYGNVDIDNVQGLVHGAMFTRGPAHLKNTALFIGGANVQAGEMLLDRIRKTFFGPVRVSAFIDSNGCNTTAAAAVLCAARHITLAGKQALVLGGTGPVGSRAARLLAWQHAHVCVASRSHERAQAAATAIEVLAQERGQAVTGKLTAVAQADSDEFRDALSAAEVIISCGAAGVQMLDEQAVAYAKRARVMIDLNAVPPTGIASIAATDKAVEHGGRVHYGAIGAGGLKMKIQLEALRTVFTRNDLILDCEEIFEIGAELEAANTV